VALEITRVLSDLHYGDPGSRVRSLDALAPLFAGADRIVLNGDTLETRDSPITQETDARRAEFLEFARRAIPRCTLITGNHDADLSETHHLDLLGGLVFIFHGEILFEELVPWSRELPQIRILYGTELAALTAEARADPWARLAACKRACAKLRLHHNPHATALVDRAILLGRIVWPPRCPLAMLRAWRELPERAADFVQQHRPKSRFVLVGHTHFPGVWVQSGVVVINTGSFRPPFGCYAVDLSAEAVVVRKVVQRGGAFALGRVVAAFSLAPTDEGSGAVATILPNLAPSQ